MTAQTYTITAADKRAGMSLVDLRASLAAIPVVDGRVSVTIGWRGQIQKLEVEVDVEPESEAKKEIQDRLTDLLNGAGLGFAGGQA